jgi:hypothetical protein
MQGKRQAVGYTHSAIKGQNIDPTETQRHAASEELWDECQLVHEKHKAGPRPTSNPKAFAFPLTKLLCCPHCGGSFTSHRNGNGKRHYRDLRGKAHACSQRQLFPADMVEGQIIEYLSAIQLPQSWLEEILAQITALQPTEKIDLEEATHLLSNAGDLLKEATRGELDIIFHRLFEKIYLDHGYAESGYICAIDPKPMLYELISVANLPKLDSFYKKGRD